MRFPREHGALAIALASFACGWAAARVWAWSPLAIPPAIVLALMAAAPLRGWRRGAESAPSCGLTAAAAAAGLAFVALRGAPPAWMAALILPAAAYAILVGSPRERSVPARLAAVVVLTSPAPLAFGAASGRWDAVTAHVWTGCFVYFTFVAFLVMGRLRGSAAALWTVRVAGPLAAIGAVALGGVHLMLAPAFLIPGLRAWSAAPEPVNPIRAGAAELAWTGATLPLLAFGLAS